MARPENLNALSVKVARLYHYQGLTTERIARELGLSRSKVSRLLTHARQAGLIEIRVHDPEAQPQELERQIQDHFHIPSVEVVTVPLNSTEDEWLKGVALYAAKHINNIVHSEMVVGLAWGATIDAISRQLTPKRCVHVDIVQLNGSGNVYGMSNFYIGDIYTRFAMNYGGRAHLFPVPAFFDHRESKQAMWKERSVQRIKEMAAKADLLVYSIGSPDARIPSYVHAGGFLEPNDTAELQREGVVGDIATVFFRFDGSYDKIPLNERASGPDLSLFKRAKHALCVVSGLAKAVGVRAALRGGLMSELIVDEPTARAILWPDSEELPEHGERRPRKSRARTQAPR
jgi:DNA-binding transcriptional regulator LsrR (DeoR family)